MAEGKTAGVLVIVCLLCGVTHCLPTAKVSDYDVDGGRDLDIFDINEEAGLDLFEGDIVLDERQARNSIIGDQYRWPRTIPYYMEDDLEINAKGVILKAFEQYRLKTCIDFKPWSGEENYISIFKGSGCFSSVGNRRVGKQRLSIGANCDRIATIEHEFLHALGFWHEQSRADRDDYVKIMWDLISEGKEHNFNTYDDTTSSSLGVPYDYGSMMHYSKNAFRNGTEPTIVTKIPAFSDVIGQRMEFSNSDLLKLSRLYNCTQGSTFLDSCDFERENICGMVVTGHWARVSTAAGGPTTDYSNLGKCTGSGYFMHHSNEISSPGQHKLESRFLYPKRGNQCLQFFYYSSTEAKDIIIYTEEYDGNSTKLSLNRVISGSTQGQWQLHHVSLNATRKFRFGFMASVLNEPAPGGASLDDINISETPCPEFVWRVKNFKEVMENATTNTSIFSPLFTSKEGYTFQMELYPNGKAGYAGELSAYAHLVAREGDAEKKWPCPWKQITMMLMDQNPHIQKRMSNQRSVTTDPNMKAPDSGQFLWDDPRKVGVEVTDTDGSKYFRGPGAGTAVYLTHLRAKSRDFIKGGDAIFLLTMEDVSHLTVSQPLPSASPSTGPTSPTTPADQTTPTTPTTPTDPTTPTTPTDPTTPTTPTDPTTSITDACTNVKCLSDGICVVDAGIAVCRCLVGDDWWYYGDRCQYKGSNQDKTTLALASSLSVLAAMLLITAGTVFFLRRRYKKRAHESSITMAKIGPSEKF